MTRRCALGLAAVLFLTGTSFRAAAHDSTDGRAVDMPFDFDRDEILLQVRVNGKGAFTMMLDTGTDPSAVDLATAKDIGLEMDPVGQRATGGGTDVNLAYATELPLVEVGGLTARNVEALAIDLSAVSRRLGRPVHGILGHSLLKGRIVQIDYPRRVVRFFAKSPFSKSSRTPNTATHTVLKFRYDDNVLVDDVTVNGKTMVGNFDTGSNGAFQLAPGAAASLGLEEQLRTTPSTTSVGYNGISESREVRVANVTVGGISVDGPTVLVFGRGTGRDQSVWGVDIGNAFLKEFVVTIDYPNRRIMLERS